MHTDVGVQKHILGFRKQSNERVDFGTTKQNCTSNVWGRKSGNKCLGLDTGMREGQRRLNIAFHLSSVAAFLKGKKKHGNI